jgi:Asp-tRNA(Asn)/Glu-tRNA(Gln) amidotransferase A subunit family amidase
MNSPILDCRGQPIDLTYRNAIDVARLIASGEVSAAEVLEASLARLEATEPLLNAFAVTLASEARRDAQAADLLRKRGDQIGPLHGVPVSVKDLVAVGGAPFMLGSRSMAHNVAPADAASVERLRKAGAIIIGKTTTSEYGCKAVGDSPLTGSTVNPWDLSKTAGGSSAGAAASVAAGVTAIAVGTDGGGSIRIPAALCGLVGVKPQFGRVPVFPTAATPTLAHVCPMARTVRDAALLLTVLAGYDARDPFSVPLPVPDVMAACEHDPRPLRIAWSPAFGYAPVDPEVRAIAERAARTFADFGCTVDEIEAPFGADPADLWTAEFYAGIGARLGPVLRERPGTLDRDIAAIVERAIAESAEDYYRAVFGRYEFRERVRRFFDVYDLLLSPTLPVAGVDAGVAIPPALPDRNIVTWVCYTYPFNLTGQPAASIPAGFTAAGLPVGLQIVARPYREEDVFAAAAAFESARPWTAQRPTLRQQ